VFSPAHTRLAAAARIAANTATPGQPQCWLTIPVTADDAAPPTKTQVMYTEFIRARACGQSA
jgi:hypothetical protein